MRKIEKTIKRIFAAILSCILIITVLPATDISLYAAKSALYEPLEIKSGFNRDVVLEKTGITGGKPSFSLDYVQSYYAETTNWQYTFATQEVIRQFNTSTASTGFPASREIECISTATKYNGLYWKLAPYDQKNAICLQNYTGMVTEGTLEFSKIGCYQKLYILAGAGGIPDSSAVMQATVWYTDNTSDSATFTVYDHAYTPSDQKGYYDTMQSNDNYANSKWTMAICELNVNTTKLIKSLKIKNASSKGGIFVMAVTGKVVDIGIPSPSTTNIGDLSFDIGWPAASGAVTYRVDVATDENFQNMLSGYNNKQVSGTSLTVSGLSRTSTYYYRVRSENAAGGQGASSAVKSVTTTDTRPYITYEGLSGATLSTPNPDRYAPESLPLTLNNPTKSDGLFAGWTGTGITTATKTAVIPAGTTGNCTFTANWHYHSFATCAKDNVLYCYCANNMYSSVCEHQGSELNLTDAVSLNLEAQDASFSDSGYSLGNITLTGLSEFNSIAGLSLSSANVKFYTDAACTIPTGTDDGATSEGGAPKKAGDYFAALTANSKTAVDAFSIGKIDHETITATMEDYQYGQDSLPNPVLDPREVPDNPEISFYYNESDSTSDGKEWKDMTTKSLPAGTYYFYAKVAASDNYNEYVTATDSFEVTKGTATVDIEPEISLTYGTTLEDAELTNGETSVPGKFVWPDNNKDEKPEVSDRDTVEYELLFVPDDENIEPVTIKVKAKVEPKAEETDKVTIVLEDNTVGPITVEGSDTPLVKDVDYEIKTVEKTGDSVEVVIELKGNYSGTITKIITAPKGEGNIKSFVEMTDNTKNLTPSMVPLTRDASKTVLLNNISDDEVKEKVAADDDSINYEGNVYLLVKSTDESNESKAELSKIEEESEKLIGEKPVGIAATMDISMFLEYRITDVLGNVVETDKKKITDSGSVYESLVINIPEEYINTDPKITRTFYVFRAHTNGGNVETTLLAKSLETRIVITSNQFSSYVIYYTDTVIPDGDPDTPPSPTPNPGPSNLPKGDPAPEGPLGKISPKTSDRSGLYMYSLLMGMGFIGLATVFRKKK